jgi:hypothetical protein
MGPLDPLLMYMVFGLPNSVTKWILRSSFAPVERGAEAGSGGPKSAAAGQKSVGIGQQSVAELINQTGREGG